MSSREVERRRGGAERAMLKPGGRGRVREDKDMATHNGRETADDCVERLVNSIVAGVRNIVCDQIEQALDAGTRRSLREAERKATSISLNPMSA